jgi:hypothetical protein
MLQQDMGWDDYANDLCEELDANGDGLVSFAEFVIGFRRFCDKAFTPQTEKYVNALYVCVQCMWFCKTFETGGVCRTL